MTYTKDIALHDKITVDGTDVSNAFNAFNLTSDGTLVDVSGFSASGKDQNLVGAKAEQFTGTAFYTPEIYNLLWPLHEDDAVFEVIWQPEGLIDPSREVYWAMCQMPNWDPAATRGTARTMAVVFNIADDNGVQSGAAT